MEEKVYNVFEIDKEGNETINCKVRAYNIEEAVYELARLKEGNKIELIKSETDTAEIVLNYTHAHSKPEIYLIVFSHLLKDGKIETKVC